MIGRREGGHLVSVQGIEEEETLHLLGHLHRREVAPLGKQSQKHTHRTTSMNLQYNMIENEIISKRVSTDKNDTQELTHLSECTKDSQLRVAHAHVFLVRLRVVVLLALHDRSQLSLSIFTYNNKIHILLHIIYCKVCI